MAGKGKDRNFDYITHGLNVCFGLDRWAGSNALTKDPSIAAWMMLYSAYSLDHPKDPTKRLLDDLIDRNAHTAAAVNGVNKWVIDGAKRFEATGDPNMIKIKLFEEED